MLPPYECMDTSLLNLWWISSTKVLILPGEERMDNSSVNLSWYGLCSGRCTHGGRYLACLWWFVRSVPLKFSSYQASKFYLQFHKVYQNQLIIIHFLPYQPTLQIPHYQPILNSTFQVEVKEGLEWVGVAFWEVWQIHKCYWHLESR